MKLLRTKRKRDRPCECPRCLGVKTADPKWGFDRAKVPKVHCMRCKRPIGKARYVLDTGLARFGTMLFYHQACHQECRPAIPSHGKIRGRHSLEVTIRHFVASFTARLAASSLTRR